MHMKLQYKRLNIPCITGDGNIVTPTDDRLDLQRRGKNLVCILAEWLQYFKIKMQENKKQVIL